MSLYVAPYKAGSASAKSLAKALNALRIKTSNSSFIGSEDKTVINWGGSSLSDEVLKCRVLNHPDKVALATDKLKFFNKVSKAIYEQDLTINIPNYTWDKNDAQYWVNSGHTIVERHKLKGHSGEGIKIKSGDDAIEDCPLYVLYIPKKSEWRVHVVNGEAILVQRKARKRDVPDEQVNWKVRNHCNGFVFARNEGQEPPEGLVEQAIRVISVCGLDFGAVDLIYNEKRDESYVLEVNTACGLEGSTLNDYVTAFNKMGIVDE